MSDSTATEANTKSLHLRRVFANAALLVIPLAIYFFFYASEREAQINQRNFRELDAAAARIVTLMDNFPKVRQFVALPSSEVDKLWDGLSVADIDIDLGRRVIGSLKNAANSEKDYENERKVTPEAPVFTSKWIDRFQGDRGFGTPECTEENNGVSRSRLNKEGKQSLHYDIYEGPVVAQDDEKAQLADDAYLTKRLNCFYLQLDIPVSELVKGVLPILTNDFDDVLIVNEQGEVLHRVAEAGSPALFESQLTGSDTSGNVSQRFVAFASFRPDASTTQLDNKEKTLAALVPTERDGAVGLHSHRVRFEIGGESLVAFVHPFSVGNIQVTAETSSADSASKTGPVSSEHVWYLIGIARQEAIAGASTALRLSTINDAVLLIALLMAVFVFIWLRTNGKRALLLRRHLLIAAFSGAISLSMLVMLGMLLLSELRYRVSVDAELQQHTDTMAEAFNKEVLAKWSELKAEDFCNTGKTPDTIPLLEIKLHLDKHGHASANKCEIVTNRIFKVPSANLGFRPYFINAQQGRLYSFGANSPDNSYFIERITSVLDGTIETALSAPDDADVENYNERSVIASIAHLASLDKAVLPNPYRFAVIDSNTGMTLYHSLPERNLITNFLQDINDSDALLEALRKRQATALDLVYNGEPVMAYVKFLTEGNLPWALVIYRDYVANDTANFLASTATIVLGSTLGVLLTVAIVAVPRFGDLIVERLWYFSYANQTTLLRQWNLGLLLLIGLALLLLWVAVLWGVTWCFLPVLLAAALYLLINPSAFFATAPIAEVKPQERSLAGQKLFLTCILALFFVMPNVYFFAFFSKAMDSNLTSYFKEETHSALLRRCEALDELVQRYDRSSLAQALPSDAYLKPILNTGLETIPTAWFAGCEPLRQDARAQVSQPQSVFDLVLTALGKVFEWNVSTDEDAPQTELPTISVLSYLQASELWQLFALILAGGVLGHIIVNTLTKYFLNVEVKPFALPVWKIDSKIFQQEYSRCLVIDLAHSAMKAVEDFCTKENVKVLQLIKKDSIEVDWEPLAPTQHPSQRPTRCLYIVRDIELFINRETALCAKLHAAIQKGVPLVIFTRVVPSHWLVTRETEEGKAKNRLLRVLGDFDAYQFQPDPLEKPLAEQNALAKIASLSKLMAHEADCFPELTATISRLCTNNNDQDDDLERLKLTCSIYFRRLWQVSSHEEQLQLFALANGGFVNPQLRSATNSLLARGLIVVDGHVKLKSTAFGSFIRSELDHEALNKWIKDDKQRLWTIVWQPISIVIVLALAFVFVSTPDQLSAVTTILASALGAIPLLTTVMAGLRNAGLGFGSSAKSVS
jgi:hypothetical protein